MLVTGKHIIYSFPDLYILDTDHPFKFSNGYNLVIKFRYRVTFSQCLFDLIKSKRIGFYSSEELRESLINCKVVYSNRGWRIVKKSGTKKIDLAISLAMASYGAMIALEEPESIIEGKGAGKRLSAEQDW
ncbi:hypothetical protein ES708_28090 [subsurface metagenome]